MRSLKINLIYSGAYQILLIILPLVTAPYILSIFGAEIIGEYTYIYTISYYFALSVNLGILNYGNRSIAKSNAPDITFNELFSIQICWCLGLLILYFIYLYLFVSNDRDLYFIQSILILAYGFDITWYYFGVENFKIVVLRNVIVKTITTIAIFSLIDVTSNINSYAILIALSMLGSNVCLFINYCTNNKVLLIFNDHTKDHLIKLFILFIPVISVGIYITLAKIFLGNLTNMRDVSYFEYGYKIVTAPLGLVLAIGNVTLPRICKLMLASSAKQISNLLNISTNIVFIFSMPMSIGLLLLGNRFCELFYGTQFLDCGKVVSILAFIIPCISFGNILRQQIIIPKCKDKIFIKSVVLGLIINIIVGFYLIKFFGLSGACYSSLITEFSVIFYLMICSRKEICEINLFSTVKLLLFPSLLMIISIESLCYYLGNSWFSFVIITFLGLFVYFLSLYTFNSSSIKFIFKSFK